jgi:hypothetical protein
MRAFILLYNGPPTPRNTTHEGWPEWFDGAGDRLLDMGSPMLNAFVVRADGSISDNAAPLNGFSIVAAEDRDEAVGLIRNHPFLALGSDYTVEAFEVPMRATAEETA